MTRFIEAAKKFVIGMVLLGVIAYALLMLSFVFGWEVAIDIFKPNLGYTIGLPVCAITAFAIVAALESQAENKPKSEKLNFKAFGLDFTGPAGPVTLWVVCYLTFVASMRLVP